MDQLEGRVAIITGAGRGHKDGRWSIEELAEQGPRLGEHKSDLGSPFAQLG